jgi:hypothetical protein
MKQQNSAQTPVRQQTKAENAYRAAALSQTTCKQTSVSAQNREKSVASQNRRQPQQADSKHKLLVNKQTDNAKQRVQSIISQTQKTHSAHKAKCATTTKTQETPVQAVNAVRYRKHSSQAYHRAQHLKSAIMMTHKDASNAVDATEGQYQEHAAQTSSAAQYLSLNKKGDSMAVKALVYIIITVVSVVIAVALFVKLWNVFVPDDSTGQDLQLLKERIERLVKSEKTYEQDSFILQAQDYVIFAFDAPTKSIEIALEDDLREKLRVTKTNDCDNKACLCKIKHDDLEDKGDKSKVIEVPLTECVKLDLPSDKMIYFGTDYSAYKTYISQHNDGIMLIRPLILQPAREGALANDLKYRYAVISAKFSTTTSIEKRPIMPLVLEKSTVNFAGKDSTIILLMQDTAPARSRYIYLQECNDKSSQECIDPATKKGKTPYKSFFDLNKEKYCAINPFIGSCTVQAVPECPKDTSINYPCRCDDELITNGYCKTYDCQQATECSDYCLLKTNQQGSGADCSPEELSWCAQDVCNVAKGKNYQIRCYPTGENGKAACVEGAR